MNTSYTRVTWAGNFRTIVQFVLTYWRTKPVGLDIFENEETSEKECIEIKDWDFSVHCELGFKKLHLHLTLKF